jgi:hypothetical protein
MVESPHAKEQQLLYENETKLIPEIRFTQIGSGSAAKPCPPGYLPDESSHCNSMTESVGSETKEFRTYENITFGIKLNYPNGLSAKAIRPQIPLHSL